MRTGNRISVAALVVSAATLVAVILTPPPSAPAKDSGFSPKRALLSASAEQRAVFKDRGDLKALDKRVEPLRKRTAEADAARGPDENEVIRAEVERELSRRWKEFEKRLRNLR